MTGAPGRAGDAPVRPPRLQRALSSGARDHRAHGAHPYASGGTVATALCWLAVAPGPGLGRRSASPGSERGPLVQLLAFTPYVAAWRLLPLVLALALRRWLAAVVAAWPLAVLVGVVAPRALRRPAAAGRPGRSCGCSPPTCSPARRDAAALVDLVRAHRVDVLAVQEFTPDAQARAGPAGLAELLPYRQLEPRGRRHRLGALLPLPARRRRRPAQPAAASPRRTRRCVPGAPPVLVESAHPVAPYAVDAVAGLARRPARRSRRPPRTAPLRDPGRRLQRHPRPRGAARPARHRLPRRRRRRPAPGLAGTWGPYDGDPIPPVDHRPRPGRPAASACARSPCTPSPAATTAPSSPSCRLPGRAEPAAPRRQAPGAWSAGRRRARRPGRASSPRPRSRARRPWSSRGRRRRAVSTSTRVIAPVPCEPSRMRTL